MRHVAASPHYRTRSRRSRHEHRRLILEPLEDRRMLSTWAPDVEPNDTLQDRVEVVDLVPPTVTAISPLPEGGGTVSEVVDRLTVSFSEELDAWTVNVTSDMEANLLAFGNFDALATGTPPDVGNPAGAWGWPAHYVEAGVAEPNSEMFSIVPTSSFDPARTGNSLKLFVEDDTSANYHLPNLFQEPVTAGRITLSLDIWVVSGHGGGSIYLGGGGFRDDTHRGPQLAWFADGRIICRTSEEDITLVEGYGFDQWQHVLLTIDLDNDTFDVYWAVEGTPLARIGQNLGFRSGSLNELDRFAFVNFAEATPTSHAYLDNILVLAEGPAAFDLREAGADGVFDTEDDRVYQLTLDPPYTTGTSVDLFIHEGPLPSGYYRFTANATLSDLAGNPLDGSGDGIGGDAYQRTFSVANAIPMVSGLSAEPSPVIRPGEITLAAAGVSDPDGSVVRVEFYRDDQLLGTDQTGGDRWSFTIDTAGWDPGQYTFYARAQDNDGAWSEMVSTTATVQNAPPVVASLSAVPDAVTRPGEITLAAAGVSDPDGTVMRVEFYRDEELLGTDQTAGDGWSFTIDTAGWDPGQHTLYARAQDNDGAWSAAVSVSARVTSWQNPNNRFDVNADGFVTALDVLLLVNEINRGGGGELPPRPADDREWPYWDVNGDGLLSPADALAVINFINRGSSPETSQGEGEGEPVTSSAGVVDGSWSLAVMRFDDSRDARDGSRRGSLAAPGREAERVAWLTAAMEELPGLRGANHRDGRPRAEGLTRGVRDQRDHDELLDQLLHRPLADSHLDDFFASLGKRGEGTFVGSVADGAGVPVRRV